jgi:hypothetical protein
MGFVTFSLKIIYPLDILRLPAEMYYIVTGGGGILNHNAKS